MYNKILQKYFIFLAIPSFLCAMEKQIEQKVTQSAMDKYSIVRNCYEQIKLNSQYSHITSDRILISQDTVCKDKIFVCYPGCDDWGANQQCSNPLSDTINILADINLITNKQEDFKHFDKLDKQYNGSPITAIACRNNDRFTAYRFIAQNNKVFVCTPEQSLWSGKWMDCKSTLELSDLTVEQNIKKIFSYKDTVGLVIVSSQGAIYKVDDFTADQKVKAWSDQFKDAVLAIEADACLEHLFFGQLDKVVVVSLASGISRTVDMGGGFKCSMFDIFGDKVVCSDIVPRQYDTTKGPDKITIALLNYGDLVSKSEVTNLQVIDLKQPSERKLVNLFLTENSLFLLWSGSGKSLGDICVSELFYTALGAKTALTMEQIQHGGCRGFVKHHHYCRLFSNFPARFFELCNKYGDRNNLKLLGLQFSKSKYYPSSDDYNHYQPVCIELGEQKNVVPEGRLARVLRLCSENRLSILLGISLAGLMYAIQSGKIVFA